MYDAAARIGRAAKLSRQTDKLVDAPTVRILERYFADVTRMIDAAHALRHELPPLQLADRQWAARLQKREAGLELLAALTPEPVALGA